MPPRSPRPDRLACEAALLPDELSALRSSAVELGVPPDRWTHVPALALIWGTVAIVRLAKQRRGEFPGISEDRALAIVAGDLGLSGETIRTRLRSFFRDARARCLSPDRDAKAKGNIQYHEISGGEDG